MHHNIIKCALIAAALLLLASPSIAADQKPQSPGATADTAKTVVERSEQKEPERKLAAAKVKLVDINSAGKAELKKLPNIGDAGAEKIIAGRPYLTKARLVTQNILPRETYENLKKLVIAKQEQHLKPKSDRKRQ